MYKTKIDWADSTWNPITGCRHGCEYCYAKGIANRFAGRFNQYIGENINKSDGRLNDLGTPLLYQRKNGDLTKAPYPFGFAPTLHRYRLNNPQTWTEPRTIFVGSMADIFGAWVPNGWIQEIFEACKAAPQHKYLFLTKNPQRYLENLNSGKYAVPEGDNYWYGFTHTNGSLLGLPPGRKRFASIEPIFDYVVGSSLVWEYGIDELIELAMREK